MHEEHIFYLNALKTVFLQSKCINNALAERWIHKLFLQNKTAAIWPHSYCTVKGGGVYNTDYPIISLMKMPLYLA